jgi:subtilisin family serine protease
MSVTSNSHMKNSLLLLAGFFSLLFAIEVLAEPPAWAQSEAHFKETLSVLAEKARRSGPQRVIVGVDSEFVPVGWLSNPAVKSQRNGFARQQGALLTALADVQVAEIRRFEHIPFLVLELGEDAIERLAGLPMVVSVQEDLYEMPVMASSNPVIGADLAWAAGYDGTGLAVAVLDSGVDSSHPFFSTGSKVVSEACYSSNTETADSLCPRGVEESVAPGSAQNCDLETKGCEHGTHVAGTVAGNDAMGPDYGVARGADIIAIQVFSRFEGVVTCGLSYDTCVAAYVSDQIAALERVYALRDQFNIAAVNMSLGGSRYTDQALCDEEQAARKLAIDNLRSVGIATVIASGNSSSRDSISTPACISSAVSVGATTDADAVASFSNVADFLDLYAPGVSITSSVPGGEVATWQGTSMATPHVAGAWAVLRQKLPSADVDTVLAALQATGTLVDDLRSSGTVTGIPRIQVNLALGELVDPIPEFDSSPEAGTLFDFGQVYLGRTSDPMVLQVHNLGTGFLEISCEVSGPQADSFVVSQCPGQVGEGSSVEVQFSCQAVAEDINTASLDLLTNDEDEGLVSFALDCDGFQDVIWEGGFEQ